MDETKEDIAGSGGENVKLLYYRKILVVTYGRYEETLSVILFLLFGSHCAECGITAYFRRND